MILPALMLCGWVVLLMGATREFTSLLLLVLSVVVVPAVMLANCWTPFGVMLKAGSEFLLAALALWLLAMTGLFLQARRRARAART